MFQDGNIDSIQRLARVYIRSPQDGCPVCLAPPPQCPPSLHEFSELVAATFASPSLSCGNPPSKPQGTYQDYRKLITADFELRLRPAPW
jgi:hypothetical protein